MIEGGGMRAAYANGVLAAFEEQGFDPFDAVYGTSAGGALAAWWTAGQAQHAAETWDYAQDPRIMSYRRFLTFQGPLLDHETLFEVVYEEEMPLDVQAVRQADHPVVVTVTDADTGKVHYKDVRQGPVLEWLKATGRLPLATGPPVEIDGTRWLDGGLAVPVPSRRALEDGATEIITLLNRAEGSRTPEPWFNEWVVRRKFPALEGLVRDHHELHAQNLAPLIDPPEGVTSHIIRPEEDLPVHRLSRDLEDVRQAIEVGRSDGLAFLDRYGAAAPSAVSPSDRAST